MNENYCCQPMAVNQLKTRGILPLAAQVVLREVSIAVRLAHFSQNWAVVSQDPWILDTITGYQIEFLEEPVQYSMPPSPRVSPEEAELITQEVEVMLKKGAVRELPPPPPPPPAGKKRLLLQPVSGSLKRWKDEASHKPQEAECLHPPSSFQDGGHTKPQGAPEEGRLAYKGGPEGCLLHGSNGQGKQRLPPVYYSESSLPGHMLTLWPVMCPMGLYQDPEASGGPAQRTRNKGDSVHRRPVDHVRLARKGEEPHPSSDILAGEPRVHSNTQKSSDDPYPGNRFPLACSPHPLDGALPPRSENQEVAGGSLEASGSGDSSLSEGGIQVATEDDRYVKGSTSCTIVLLTDPEGSDNKSETQQPELRHLSQESSEELRWWIEHLIKWNGKSLKDRHGDRVRCVPDRMGGNLPGYTYRGS